MLYRTPIILIALLFSLFLASATAKPKITVARDSFPTGQSTPEGAAADLARAFMAADPARFRSICVRPYGAGEARAEYENYLAGVVEHLTQKNAKPVPDNPRTISKVFAARHLTKNGPASYGYASFGFLDVMFVDVEVVLNNGKPLLRRTMVIQDRDAKWYAHPVPDISPVLSDGFYEESKSVQLFTDVYEIQR